MVRAALPLGSMREVRRGYLAPERRPVCSGNGLLGFRMQTLKTHKLGFNRNYYRFTLILPIKIVLISNLRESSLYCESDLAQTRLGRYDAAILPTSAALRVPPANSN